LAFKTNTKEEHMMNKNCFCCGRRAVFARVVFALGCAVLLAACPNPYQKNAFKKDNPPVIPVTPVTAVTPPPANTITVASDAEWTNALDYINANPGNYIVNIPAGTTITTAGVTASNLTSGVDLTLTGSGTLALSSNGRIFDIHGINTSLTLNGPTLQGKDGNNAPVVYIVNGSFTLQEGKITGNTNTSMGNPAAGGVVIGGTGHSYFTMIGGEISGNTAYIGGAVIINTGTVFTMHGGVISGNTATTSGGGVWMSYGTFTMTGGTISGNTAANYGGGVYIGDTGSITFEKTGGVIYGDTDANHAAGADENTVTSANMRGHAVYHYSSGAYRDSTLGAADNLSNADLVTGWNQ
jgi:hypothetical protein